MSRDGRGAFQGPPEVSILALRVFGGRSSQQLVNQPPFDDPTVGGFPRKTSINAKDDKDASFVMLVVRPVICAERCPRS